MGRLNHLWNASPQTLAWTLHELDLIKDPLSETDILYMQHLFLQNGLHSLKVRSVYAGRQLMQKVLQSLNIYHNQACLTLSPDMLPKGVTDVYEELQLGSYLELGDEVTLDDYFVDCFYYDFIWIEMTPELLQQEWFAAFRQRILAFNLHHNVPIVTFAAADSTFTPACPDTTCR